MHLLLPSERPQFIRAWTLQGVESIPQGCWLMLTSMLPTVVSSWLDVLWVLDHSWYTLETVECENPSWVAVLDTLKLVRLAPTTIPRTRHLNILSCPFTLWMAHIHNPILNCRKALKSLFNLSLPLHQHWLKWILQVTPIRDHSFQLNSPCQCTVCVPFRGWMGKAKNGSAFEWRMVVGARRTSLSASRTAMVLGCSRSTASRMYREWATTQRTSCQLDTTVGSIEVNMGQHPCGKLSTPCRVHAPTN